MLRVLLAAGLVMGLAGAAMAQVSASGTATGSTTTGIAKPPPGSVPPQPERLDRNNPSPQGNNTPTLPQVALHPEATIGSGTPIAGPGGTAQTPTGN